jgi:hypothetical protein
METPPFFLALPKSQKDLPGAEKHKDGRINIAVCQRKSLSPTPS